MEPRPLLHSDLEESRIFCQRLCEISIEIPSQTKLSILLLEALSSCCPLAKCGVRVGLGSLYHFTISSSCFDSGSQWLFRRGLQPRPFRAERLLLQLCQLRDPRFRQLQQSRQFVVVEC